MSLALAARMSPVDPRAASRRLLAAIFVATGLFHLLDPEAFMRIMPPYLPAHRLLVLVSGAAEIAGGIGLLIPALRRAAGWGLAALLVAVLPANVQMALRPEGTFGADFAEPLLWLRILLQPLLIVWVLWSVRRAGPPAAV